MEDFKFFSPRPVNTIEETLSLSSKTSKGGKDWEIIDEFYDPSLITKSNPKDNAQNKQNKYQGLQDFAKKIAEDEAKKIMEAQQGEKKNWLIPAIALKIKFLNPFDRNSSPKPLVEEKRFSPLLEQETVVDNFTRNVTRSKTHIPLQKQDSKMINLELQQHLDKITNVSKNFKNFNKKFPLKLPKRRHSAERKKNLNDLDESPMVKRKLSFKRINTEDHISFLHNLKPKNDKDPLKSQEFKMALSKIEQKLKSEMEINKDQEKQKEKSKNQEKVKKAGIGPWEELWEDKAEVIQENSPYGHFPSYKLRNLIIKGGDDLRQEILAMQLIIKFKDIFDKANIKLYLRPYEIIVTSANSGILGS